MHAGAELDLLALVRASSLAAISVLPRRPVNQSPCAFVAIALLFHILRTEEEACVLIGNNALAPPCAAHDAVMSEGRKHHHFTTAEPSTQANRVGAAQIANAERATANEALHLSAPDWRQK